MILIAGILVFEHSLIKPGNLRSLDKAFFNMNGIISIVFFISVLGDLYLL
jgi:4-hydroxybenzoate polyprenyltransferase